MSDRGGGEAKGVRQLLIGGVRVGSEHGMNRGLMVDGVTEHERELASKRGADGGSGFIVRGQDDELKRMLRGQGVQQFELLNECDRVSAGVRRRGFDWGAAFAMVVLDAAGVYAVDQSPDVIEAVPDVGADGCTEEARSVLGRVLTGGQ